MTLEPTEDCKTLPNLVPKTLAADIVNRHVQIPDHEIGFKCILFITHCEFYITKLVNTN